MFLVWRPAIHSVRRVQRVVAMSGKLALAPVRTIQYVPHAHLVEATNTRRHHATQLQTQCAVRALPATMAARLKRFHVVVGRTASVHLVVYVVLMSMKLPAAQ
jgi:hypothetical protein